MLDPAPVSKLPAKVPAGIAFSRDTDSFVGDESGRPGAPPLGVVRPRSGEELQTIIKWANTERVPLIPVSSGSGPRRHGDTISPQPALIVDLSGLKRIVHVDGRDAIAVIEAGVTFDELDAALRPHGLESFRPLLPRSSKSVIAAFLEREPITAPAHHWDSADPLAALELVFGNGHPFRTGGAALRGTTEENLARGNRQMLNTGPGQTDFGRMLQGAQGSLGIVARASILCHRIAARTAPWFVTADRLEPVIAAAYAMLRYRYDGRMLIANRAQLALMLAPDAPSCAALRDSLPGWTMFIEVNAPAAFADEALAYRQADLEQAVSGAGATLTRALGRHDAPAFAALLSKSGPVPYKTRGGPAHEEVFFMTQLNRVQSQIEATGAGPDDIAVYLQPMTQGVNAHAEFTFFAHDQRTARTRARAAAEALSAAKVFFSRPYHLWADLAFARDPGIVPLLADIKSIFDPQHILQPGSQALGGSRAFAIAAA